MKRILLALALVVLILMPVRALAQTAKTYNDGQDLPYGATEQETWRLVGSAWVSQGVASATALARAWTSGGNQGSCNMERWETDVTIHASVAQWINWSVSATRWDWRVMKPGTYATDCITFRIQSNNDVLIDYSGFADLQYQQQGGVKQTIDTWYAVGPVIPSPTSSAWITAAGLNDHDDLVLDSADLHAGLSFKLWNKIRVEDCNSSSEYEDTATVTLILQNIKRWVDPGTGGWKDLLPPPPV